MITVITTNLHEVADVQYTVITFFVYIGYKSSGCVPYCVPRPNYDTVKPVYNGHLYNKIY